MLKTKLFFFLLKGTKGILIKRTKTNKKKHAFDKMHLRNEYIAFFFNGLRVKLVFNIRGTAVLELNDSRNK